jgi:hypothetical protein
VSAYITVHTRKRLWARSGNQCAYPGCNRELLMPTAAGDDDTIIGKECHIVAQADDDPSVARSPCLLTEEERIEWAQLIEHRHSYANLVLMCGVHSDLIDDPKQQISIAQLVQIKRAHEQEVADRQREEQAESIRSAEGAGEGSQFVWPVLVDDVGSWQHKAVVALASDEPGSLRWLRGEIGDPPDPDRVSGLIARWSDVLADASDLLALAAIRHAEALGLWSDAADGWEHLAARSSGADRADRLVRAAIDAQVGGEGGRHERLLAEAEDADPDCARLHLERMDPGLSPRQQLAQLNEIDTEDKPLRALISCHKALTSLFLPDLDAAAEYLAEAEQLDPGSMTIRSVEINIRIQRARIALISDQTFSLAGALSAQQDALSLREELIAMGRWSESGRLLMLASDVSSMLRDLQGAESLLRRAQPEELGTPDGPVVLGDAALRSGAPKLALEFTEHAAESDAIKRMRAAANIDLGGPPRTEGLETLEALALSNSPEREHAAAERLVACMSPVRAPWNEQVAEVLVSSPHADLAARLRPMSIATSGNFPEAERLAANLPDDAPSAEVRLRIAAMRGQHTGMREAAERFLEFAPDASGRLLAATALAHAGELRRAGEITALIAHDPNSPPRIRADAFATLLQTLADRNRWEDANREWQAFRDFSNQELRGGDERVSAWQVRVFHHRHDRRGRG